MECGSLVRMKDAGPVYQIAWMMKLHCTDNFAPLYPDTSHSKPCMGQSSRSYLKHFSLSLSLITKKTIMMFAIE